MRRTISLDLIPFSYYRRSNIRSDCTTDELLTRSYGESSRLGNLAADAILARFPDSVAAFTNSGGIREDIAAGDITLGDVINSFPFPKHN
jgi:2',3'-cyclic-nucleotide 2'-phosphodiesterase (5'-nucleotidase family)